jgi:glycosyltransferase involved in cell wall biosynthesis
VSAWARSVAAPADAAVRVVQFMPTFAIGGMERQVMHLGLGLDRGRFDVRFACLRRAGDLLRHVAESRRPVSEYLTERVYGVNALRRQAEFARDLRRNGIQIVHTYNFKVNAFGIPAARLAGTPVVVAGIRDTCDDLPALHRRVQRLTCRMADAVIVNADAIKRRLVGDGYDPDTIQVIRNGIDLTRFAGRHEPGRVRRELGLAADVPLVAVFARLNPVKGIEYFLEAAVAVTARFPGARFLVVGTAHAGDDDSSEHPYKRKLEAYAASLGLADRLLFTGFRRDVPALLAECSVSVLPCVRNEGLSNSVLESMAGGVPVVATTVGGNPEAVEDGVTGLLVPPCDAGALARAVCAILEDRERAARLGRAARERAVRHFSIERLVGRTEQFYLALLAKKASGAARRPATGHAPGTESPR